MLMYYWRPPSRMMWWLAVLLLVTGCIFQCGVNIVSSDYITIETSELTSETAQQSAVSKLCSSSTNQELWWQLASTNWHDSALRRYFAAGPLEAEEMEALAAARQSGNAQQDLMHTLKISLKGPTDLLQALQNICTTVCRLKSSIPGTGQITASLWTLMFKCIGGPSCSQGMVPMVIVNNTADYGGHSYASLWLPVSTSLLVNAAPSFINELGRANPVPAALDNAIGSTDFDILALDNVRRIRPCPHTPLTSCRTLLDTAYGLVPGSFCIQIDPRSSEYAHHQIKLLVSMSVSSLLNSSASAYAQQFHLDHLIAGYRDLYRWIVLPFEECSEVLIVSFDQLIESDQSVIVCSSSTCVSSSLRRNISCRSADSEDISDGGELLHRLAALVAVAKLSPECTSLTPTHKGEQPTNLNDLVPSIRPTFSCSIFSASVVCKGSYNLIEGGMSMVNPRSNWTYTEGMNTSEFQAAPNKARHAPCAIKECRVFEAIQMRARSYLTSHISEHNIAFTTAKGAATDLYTFTALVVSTALSVMVAIAGHFTNLLLKWMCRMRPFYLEYCEGAAGKARKLWAKVAFLVGCNVALSIVSFLPVLSVAWNELEREQPFHTWDLGSKDFVHPDFGFNEQLRIFYLLSATSYYSSHFIPAITTVVSFTCSVVALGTIRRSNLIFKRYRLLQQYDLAFGSSCLASHDETIEVTTMRALRAIEMTKVEYLEKTKEMRLKNIPLEDLPSTSTSPPTTPSSHPTPKRIYSLPLWPQNNQSPSMAKLPIRKFSMPLSFDEAQTSTLFLSKRSV